MASTTIIQATATFAFTRADGVQTTIHRGETFHRDSPRLKGLSGEALEGDFKSFTPDHDIEQATAAPGEKRSTRLKRTKPKPEPEAGPESEPEPDKPTEEE